MAASSNRDYFFQTTASIADNERKQRKAANTLGDPVRYQTKLLAILVNYGIESDGGVACVAEAGGVLSAISLPTNEVTRVGAPATAPLTSIAYSPVQAEPSGPVESVNIYAGCWDKKILRYNVVRNSDNKLKAISQDAWVAHSDFVKCLLVAPTADNQRVLISGGADGEVNFWTLTGTRLATLRPNCRGIECLALDPVITDGSPSVFFGTSQREIFQVTLPNLKDITTSNLKISPPIIVHETSVYQLHFDMEGDLWTASADKTSKHLSREHNWAADTTLTHPDFVKDVAVDNRTGTVFTACRDEEIRVWNLGTGQLVHVFTGHFEEVTGLAITGQTLLSVSIDATLRRWPIGPADLQREIDKAKNPDLLADNPEPAFDTEGVLTAEEEAELRALMEEEEEETLEKMAMDQQ